MDVVASGSLLLAVPIAVLAGVVSFLSSVRAATWCRATVLRHRG
ncbi:hypothetical protein [Nonomuraea rubra]